VAVDDEDRISDSEVDVCAHCSEWLSKALLCSCQVRPLGLGPTAPGQFLKGLFTQFDRYVVNLCRMAIDVTWKK
jgi:hypothetical protein